MARRAGAAPLIEVRGLIRDFPSGTGALRVLKGIDLTIGQGDFVALMGPSGSGKSTLLALLGLLDMPTGGSYRLDGQDTVALGHDARARLRNDRIGFVFQAFNLLPRGTAAENVELPLLYAGTGRAERRRRALAALDAVDLSERAGHWPGQLSGGEQQRVAIARAIANDPELILADEPTGALDTRTGLAVMAILQALNQSGRTVVVVTHDEAIARHAARVIRIADGRIVRDAAIASRADALASLREVGA